MNRRRQKIRKRKAGKSGKTALKICGAALGVLAAAYLGTALYFHFHFLPNTEINGVDFSGKTAEELDDYLKSRIDGYSLTVVGRENVTDEIRAEDISLTFKGDGKAENMLGGQNVFLWPAAFFREDVSEVGPAAEYDENALNEKIQTLKQVSGEQTEPGSS